MIQCVGQPRAGPLAVRRKAAGAVIFDNLAAAIESGAHNPSRARQEAVPRGAFTTRRPERSNCAPTT
jgi:hypothetical protein